MNVRMAKHQKIKVTGAADVVPIMWEILLREDKRGQNKEHFWCIGLANDHHILYIELVSLGSVNAAIVNPKEVMELASIKGAVNLILVHNHPSGTLTPSAEDKRITDRLIQAAKLLEREVLDHLIISPTDYYSFMESGLLEELRQSLTYVVPYELEDRGMRKKAIEMAKAMVKDKKPMSEIRKYTKLSKKELEKLQK